MTRRTAIGFSLALLALFAAMAASSAGQIAEIQDIMRYRDIGMDVRAAMTGIGTLKSEYPPLALLLFFMTGSMSGVPFAAAWICLIVLMLGMTVVYALKYLEPRAAPFLLLACLLLPFLLSSELVFARYDILVMFLLFLAWKSHQRTLYTHSALFLALATCLKLVPILALPLLFFATPEKNRIAIVRGLLIGLGIGLVLPFLLIGPGPSLSAVSPMLQYHGLRNVQVESMWSSLQLLLSNLGGHRVVLENASMSMNNPALGGWVVPLSAVLILSGVAVIALFCRNAQRTARFPSAFLATFLWALACTPVLSPQYFVWIVPLLLVCAFDALSSMRWMRGNVLVAFVVSISLLTRWIFPDHYGDLLDQHTLKPLLVLVVRNTLVVCAVLFLLWQDIVSLIRSIKWRLTPRSPRKASSFPLRSTLLFFVLLLLLGVFHRSITPSFSTARVQYDGHPVTVEEMPFFLPTLLDSLTVDTVMTLGTLRPSLFNLRPDDCIVGMAINGVRLPSTLVEFCEYGGGRTVNLAPYVQTGVNFVHFEIGDTGGAGGMSLSMSRFDHLFLLELFLLSAFLFWYGLMLCRLPFLQNLRPLPLIFLSGTILRLLYVSATPMTVRTHDLDGHIEYIRFVVSHWTIPAAQAGWEFHQPPFYYFLAAAWVKLWTIIGVGVHRSIELLQIPSLLCSIAALSLGLWSALLLFPKATDRCSHGLFLGILATFPGLLYVSARVSNDALAHLLAFAFFALLLQWWRTGSVQQWYLLCLVGALAFLTKISAAPLLLTALLCFALRPGLPIRRKVQHAGGWILLLLLLTGWLPVLRLLLEQDPSRSMALGNQGMNDALAISGSFRSFAVFHPLEILQMPFNNPFADDEHRRSFFDYFFRSAFFGEYQFDSLRRFCVSILVLGLSIIPLIVMGFLRSWPRRRTTDTFLPVFITFLTVLLAAVGYAWIFRYAPNQDFRFSVLLIAPLAYYAVRGIGALPWGWLQRVARLLLLLFCLLNAAFIAALFRFG